MEMLKWQEENGKYLGFCDGDFLYRVSETSEGWIWETADEWEGECDFETEDQAMLAAQKHFNARLAMEERLADIDLEMSLEEMLEILGDELFEEARDAQLWK